MFKKAQTATKQFGGNLRCTCARSPGLARITRNPRIARDAAAIDAFTDYENVGAVVGIGHIATLGRIRNAAPDGRRQSLSVVYIRFRPYRTFVEIPETSQLDSMALSPRQTKILSLARSMGRVMVDDLGRHFDVAV